MNHPDDTADTLELIARWLEQAAPNGDGWTNRRHAERLRSGQWLNDPDRWPAWEVEQLRTADQAAMNVTDWPTTTPPAAPAATERTDTP